MQTKAVSRGYDTAAGSYLGERNLLKSGKYLQKLLKLLRTASTVLDLGCGAGVPVDDILLKNGQRVIGIDISPEMIRRARKSCRGGEYLVGEIVDLKRKEYSVQAVVSFYALFHLPRDRHGEILMTINSFLPKGGLLLMTMGDKEYEGTTDFYGTKMWFSQWGPKKNRELVKKAGFEILLDEIDTSGAERHQVIMGRKI